MALPLRSLAPAPPDPILGLTETYRADTRPEKVNLAVGVYVDETGVTPVIGPCSRRSGASSRRPVRRATSRSTAGPATRTRSET